jgi:hypothetical protein
MTTTYTTHWYALAFAHAFGGLTENEAVYNIDYLTDTIKVALTTSSYTPNQDTDAFWSTPQAYEIGNTGSYAAGGATLGTKTMTEASKVVTFDAADVQWTTMTTTFRNIVIYKVGDTAAHSPLLAYVVISADQSPSNQTVNIAWYSTGIIKVTVA